MLKTNQMEATGTGQIVYLMERCDNKKHKGSSRRDQVAISVATVVALPSVLVLSRDDISPGTSPMTMSLRA